MGGPLMDAILTINGRPVRAAGATLCVPEAAPPAPVAAETGEDAGEIVVVIDALPAAGDGPVPGDGAATLG